MHVFVHVCRSPVWLQCEDCLKWRRVPEGHYSSTPEHWNCSQNPNTMLRYQRETERGLYFNKPNLALGLENVSALVLHDALAPP